MTLYEFLEKFVHDNKIATVLELGTGMGYASSKAMIKGGAKVVVTMDLRHPEEQVVPKQILLYVGDAPLLADIIHEQYPERFDMIFMDADHDYDSQNRYWKAYNDLAKRYIVFHDRDEPGTRDFLQQLANEYKVTHVYQFPTNEPRIAIVEIP